MTTNSAGASGNLIVGNFIGVKADGVHPLPNGAGIGLEGGPDLTVGGASAADRNIISGNNGNAITVVGPSVRMERTIIHGNYLGVDRTGAVAILNYGGIELIEADHTTIGGVTAGAGNVILATNTVGIEVEISGGADGTVIQGNAIGTNFTGTLTTGVLAAGIEATNSTHTLIGGTVPGAGNLIAYARTANFLGTAVYTAQSGVSIEGNSIFGNAGEGIYGSTSVTPVLTSVTTTVVAGHFAGKANTAYHVEYFATPDTGSASAEQGQTLLGSRDATSGAAGNPDLAFSPIGGIPVGQFITATVTDPNGTTSGFSSSLTSTPPPATSADLATTVTTGPAHGKLALNADGSFAYMPDPDFSGVDGFTYVASDGRLSSDPTRVTIEVAAGSGTAGDAAGPKIVSLVRLGFHMQPTQYVLTFDEALAEVGTADLKNYRLTAPGKDGRLGTRDDVTIALKSAIYDPVAHTIRLSPRKLVPIRQRYQLTVSGLTDTAGNALDGDKDGKPGGDAVIRFDRRILAGPSVVRTKASTPALSGHHADHARRIAKSADPVSRP
jgi:hypothetical protein